FDRLLCFALEISVVSGRVSMEICGRMRQRRFARAIGKFLRFIAPAGIENSQAKVGLVFWLHVIRRASTLAEAWTAESILREFDRSDGRAPLGEFPSPMVSATPVLRARQVSFRPARRARLSRLVCPSASPPLPLSRLVSSDRVTLSALPRSAISPARVSRPASVSRLNEPRYTDRSRPGAPALAARSAAPALDRPPAMRAGNRTPADRGRDACALRHGRCTARSAFGRRSPARCKWCACEPFRRRR